MTETVQLPVRLPYNPAGIKLAFVFFFACGIIPTVALLQKARGITPTSLVCSLACLLGASALCYCYLYFFPEAEALIEHDKITIIPHQFMGVGKLEKTIRYVSEFDRIAVQFPTAKSLILLFIFYGKPGKKYLWIGVPKKMQKGLGSYDYYAANDYAQQLGALLKLEVKPITTWASVKTAFRGKDKDA